LTPAGFEFPKICPLWRARFREVELTFAELPQIPADLPTNWIQLSASGTTVRFVDNAFHPETIHSEILHYFTSVQNANFALMTIRNIFLALAKSARKAA